MLTESFINDGILNMTPHAINIITEIGTVTIEPSGFTIRVSQSTVSSGSLVVDEGIIPLSATEFSDEILIVDSNGATVSFEQPLWFENIIVSRIAASALAAAGHTDINCFVPNEMVRDDSGRIIGCRSLTQVL